MRLVPTRGEGARTVILSGDVVKKAAEAVTSKVPNPFDHLKGNEYITPLIDPLFLSRMCDMNSTLRSCVDAYQANIAGFGYQIVPRSSKLGSPAEDVLDEIEAAKNWFDARCRDVDGKPVSLTGLKKLTTKLLEESGDVYWEVARDMNGRIAALRVIPSHQVRLSPIDDAATLHYRKVVGIRNGAPVVEEMPERTRFRRYVVGYLSAGVSETKWFKDFGDPRDVYSRDGKVAVPNDSRQGKDELANEIIHFSIACSYQPYGMPRWLASLLQALGARSAAEINLTTFDNNNIPSMAITVSNGRLTEATALRIKEHVESQIQGKRNYSNWLLLEAESGLEGDESNQAKVKFDPLVNAQHTDELFREYTKSTAADIRQSFRLPAIFCGDAGQVEKSTAELLYRKTDEQVFAPLREDGDWFMNHVLFPAIGFVKSKIVSRTPNITDNATLVQMAATAERTGGMTPRISRTIINDMVPAASDLPEAKGIDLDTPFSLTMAEMVKSQADPTEINQVGPPVQPPIDAKERAQKRISTTEWDLAMNLGSGDGD
jgi:PBSX family phage portal protein